MQKEEPVIDELYKLAMSHYDKVGEGAKSTISRIDYCLGFITAYKLQTTTPVSEAPYTKQYSERDMVDAMLHAANMGARFKPGSTPGEYLKIISAAPSTVSEKQKYHVGDVRYDNVAGFTNNIKKPSPEEVVNWYNKNLVGKYAYAMEELIEFIKDMTIRQELLNGETIETVHIPSLLHKTTELLEKSKQVATAQTESDEEIEMMAVNYFDGKKFSNKKIYQWAIADFIAGYKASLQTKVAVEGGREEEG